MRGVERDGQNRFESVEKIGSVEKNKGRNSVLTDFNQNRPDFGVKQFLLKEQRRNRVFAELSQNRSKLEVKWGLPICSPSLVKSGPS